MSALEADPTRQHELGWVNRRLGQIELDPFDRRLGTRHFDTATLALVRATPCPPTDWWVLWHPSDDEDDVIVVRLVLETKTL